MIVPIKSLVLMVYTVVSDTPNLDIENYRNMNAKTVWTITMPHLGNKCLKLIATLCLQARMNIGQIGLFWSALQLKYRAGETFLPFPFCKKNRDSSNSAAMRPQHPIEERLFQIVYPRVAQRNSCFSDKHIFLGQPNNMEKSWHTPTLRRSK